MNRKFAKTFCLLVALAFGGVVCAQVPTPTPQPVSSKVRQQLRAAILKVASSSDPNIANVRPDLALPMAKLGDWDSALRLLHNDMNAPRHNDELWHWRAYQLARAGKWAQFRAASTHIQHLPTRVDVFLFAARTAVDNGTLLNASTSDSRELHSLLLAVSPILQKGGTIQQKAYYGYLWARGGDYRAAERVFARLMDAAIRADEQAIATSKKNREPVHHFTAGNVRDVLSFQERAGLLTSALKHAARVGDNQWGWWIMRARTRAELKLISREIEKLPANRRVSHLYALSLASSIRGDKAQGRSWFEQAELLTDNKIPDPKMRGIGAGDPMYAFLAAHFLGDAALQEQTKQRYRTYLAAMPPEANDTNVADIEILPAFFDLQMPQLMGAQSKTIKSARLAEITAELRAAAPSDLQFRALENLATYLFLQKQTENLLPVAQSMLQTAQTLAAAERAKLAKKSGPFNPYWPRSPRVLTSIFWLQRAGDQQAAATFAREFARNVPDKQRPYAAMALLQLGFPSLANKVFDPKREIPLILAKQREDYKKKKFSWDYFMSWGDFAATEARFRSPAAPFRWIDKIEDSQGQAQALMTWISSLYPETRRDAPYVSVSPNGSSSSF